MPYTLTNFEIQKCCQNKPRFKSVYSRGYLSIVKDRSNTIYLEE